VTSLESVVKLLIHTVDLGGLAVVQDSMPRSIVDYIGDFLMRHQCLPLLFSRYRTNSPLSSAKNSRQERYYPSRSAVK